MKFKIGDMVEHPDGRTAVVIGVIGPEVTLKPLSGWSQYALSFAGGTVHQPMVSADWTRM